MKTKQAGFMQLSRMAEKNLCSVFLQNKSFFSHSDLQFMADAIFHTHHTKLHTHHTQLHTHHIKLHTHRTKLHTHHNKLHTHHTKLHTHHTKLHTHHAKLHTHHTKLSDAALVENCVKRGVFPEI